MKGPEVLSDSNPSLAVAPDAAAPKGTDWWGEAKGVFWLILAVLAFHSLLAKPF
jgi:signal peptidase I